MFSDPRDGESAPKPSPTGILVLYVSAGLAFLSKGPIGPILLGAPICAWLLLTRRWYFLRSWSHLPGVFLFLLLCLFWPLALYLRGGRELLDGFLIQNLLYRVFETDESLYHGGHLAPPWYYLSHFPQLTLPWLLAYPAALRWLAKGGGSQASTRGALGFLALILPFGILLLSIPATKRPLYILPLIAGQSAFVGLWLADLVHERVPHWLDRLTQGVFAAALTIAPVLVVGTLLAVHLDWLATDNLPTRPKEFLGGGAAVAWILLALLLGVLAFFCWRLLGTGSPSVNGLLLGTVLFLVVVYNLTYYPFREPQKNIRELPKGLVQLGAIERPLLGYGLDQSIREIIPLYTGTIVANYRDAGALSREVEQDGDTCVLVRESKMANLSETLLSRFVQRARWDYSKLTRSVYVLLEPYNEGRSGSE